MPFKGFKHSPETIEKMRKSHMGHKAGMSGKKHSDEARKKISETRKKIYFGSNTTWFGKKRPNMVWLQGENNPSWKGDKVGYVGLHIWVRKHLPIPELCQICEEVPPIHLANITGIYNRDFINWQYLCALCHVTYDGTINNLKMGSNRKCKNLY